MIATILRIGVLRLRNNPLELLLMFVVPIVFFSIFALIFGRGIGSGKSTPVKVLFVNQDRTEFADRLISKLTEEPGLENALGADSVVDAGKVDTGKVDTGAIDTGATAASFSRDEAMAMIQTGQATLAIVLPQHFGDTLRDGREPSIEMLVDTSDQIATQVVSALVRQAVYAERGRAAATSRGSNPKGPSGVEPAIADSIPDMITICDVLASEKANPRISMYAAGIAVMFLLFSASGAGGTLLEEQEEGTLERLLSSQLSVGQLLAGKWIYITICGSLQLLVMFVFAQVVFQVDLMGHLSGFAAMTAGTAAAASSLSLLLATVCHSRSQLNGVSVILILTMSALGGSMVPRYIM
ncbi:MAG: ABC transporter permease, partial [Pirellulaceae bacterium]|nr:ABC transporter permease [Pirellulaceae bacterium]